MIEFLPQREFEEGTGSMRPCRRWDSPWLFFPWQGFGESFTSSKMELNGQGGVLPVLPHWEPAGWDEGLVLSFSSSYFPSPSLLIAASSFRLFGPKPGVCIDRNVAALSVPGWKLGQLWGIWVFLGIGKIWNVGDTFACRAGWEVDLRRGKVLWLLLFCSQTFIS